MKFAGFRSIIEIRINSSPSQRKDHTLLNNGTARIWDISANRCLTTFKEHGRRNELERVYSVTYTPDGKYIIAISSKTSVSTINGNIIIWDSETGECLKSFENIPGLMVSGIDFTCLHPESDFSDDLKELLRQYGAIID